MQRELLKLPKLNAAKVWHKNNIHIYVVKIVFGNSVYGDCTSYLE